MSTKTMLLNTISGSLFSGVAEAVVAKELNRDEQINFEDYISISRVFSDLTSNHGKDAALTAISHTASFLTSASAGEYVAGQALRGEKESLVRYFAESIDSTFALGRLTKSTLQHMGLINSDEVLMLKNLKSKSGDTGVETYRLLVSLVECLDDQCRFVDVPMQSIKTPVLDEHRSESSLSPQEVDQIKEHINIIYDIASASGTERDTELSGILDIYKGRVKEASKLSVMFNSLNHFTKGLVKCQNAQNIPELGALHIKLAKNHHNYVADAMTGKPFNLDNIRDSLRSPQVRMALEMVHESLPRMFPDGVSEYIAKPLTDIPLALLEFTDADYFSLKQAANVIQEAFVENEGMSALGLPTEEGTKALITAAAHIGMIPRERNDVFRRILKIGLIQFPDAVIDQLIDYTQGVLSQIRLEDDTEYVAVENAETIIQKSYIREGEMIEANQVIADVQSSFEVTRNATNIRWAVVDNTTVAVGDLLATYEVDGVSKELKAPISGIMNIGARTYDDEYYDAQESLDEDEFHDAEDSFTTGFTIDHQVTAKSASIVSGLSGFEEGTVIESGETMGAYRSQIDENRVEALAKIAYHSMHATKAVVVPTSIQRARLKEVLVAPDQDVLVGTVIARVESQITDLYALKSLNDISNELVSALSRPDNDPYSIRADDGDRIFGDDAIKSLSIEQLAKVDELIALHPQIKELTLMKNAITLMQASLDLGDSQTARRKFLKFARRQNNRITPLNTSEAVKAGDVIGQYTNNDGNTISIYAPTDGAFDIATGMLTTDILAHKNGKYTFVSQVGDEIQPGGMIAGLAKENKPSYLHTQFADAISSLSKVTQNDVERANSMYVEITQAMANDSVELKIAAFHRIAKELGRIKSDSLNALKRAVCQLAMLDTNTVSDVNRGFECMELLGGLSEEDINHFQQIATASDAFVNAPTVASKLEKAKSLGKTVTAISDDGRTIIKDVLRRLTYTDYSSTAIDKLLDISGELALVDDTILQEAKTIGEMIANEEALSNYENQFLMMRDIAFRLNTLNRDSSDSIKAVIRTLPFPRVGEGLVDRILGSVDNFATIEDEDILHMAAIANLAVASDASNILHTSDIDMSVTLVAELFNAIQSEDYSYSINGQTLNGFEGIKQLAGNISAKLNAELTENQTAYQHLQVGEKLKGVAEVCDRVIGLDEDSFDQRRSLILDELTKLQLGDSSVDSNLIGESPRTYIKPIGAGKYELISSLFGIVPMVGTMPELMNQIPANSDLKVLLENHVQRQRLDRLVIAGKHMQMISDEGRQQLISSVQSIMPEESGYFESVLNVTEHLGDMNDERVSEVFNIILGCQNLQTIEAPEDIVRVTIDIAKAMGSITPELRRHIGSIALSAGISPENIKNMNDTMKQLESLAEASLQVGGQVAEASRSFIDDIGARLTRAIQSPIQSVSNSEGISVFKVAKQVMGNLLNSPKTNIPKNLAILFALAAIFFPPLGFVVVGLAAVTLIIAVYETVKLGQTGTKALSNAQVLLGRDLEGNINTDAGSIIKAIATMASATEASITPQEKAAYQLKTQDLSSIGVQVAPLAADAARAAFNPVAPNTAPAPVREGAEVDPPSP